MKSEVRLMKYSTATYR